MTSDTGNVRCTVGPGKRRPGRPLGELQALLASAAAVAPGTVRELAERTQMGYAVARYTVQNMVKRGALVQVGRAAVPGTSRGAGVFGVAPAAGAAGALAGAGTDALALALRAWPRNAMP